nr:MAG TPA: hypothetical protein [Caudoviricetes sp.]
MVVLYATSLAFSILTDKKSHTFGDWHSAHRGVLKHRGDTTPQKRGNVKVR